jgi:hypothetical protein
MAVNPDTQLQRGLEMTHQMLERVKAGEWEAVAELGRERLQLLKQWSQVADPHQAQAHIGVLQKIQALDQEIETLGRQSRDEASKQLRQLRKFRKADKAYRG